MLPIDPTADRGRRAWLPCPSCDHGSRCSDCQGAKNCATHWQYQVKFCTRSTAVESDSAHSVPTIFFSSVSG